MLRIFHLLCHSQAMPWEFIAVSLCIASNHSNSFKEAKQFSFVVASLPLSPRFVPPYPNTEHGRSFPFGLIKALCTNVTS